jgi:AraC-like DNA-binding protein
MKDVKYDFVELESDASFRQLGKTFGGTYKWDAFSFDTALVKGKLIRKVPQKGLWIRKWKLTVFDKIILHRQVAPPEHEKKFNLLFFLNPSIFELKQDLKKLSLNSQKNTVFLSNDSVMDFSVVPKQPFYVLDITFNVTWLRDCLRNMDDDAKNLLEHKLIKASKTTIMEPCPLEEYKTLYELDALMQVGKKTSSLIEVYTHQLIFSFLNRLCTVDKLPQKQRCFHYEQVVEVASIIARNLNNPPKIAAIAKMVNMSPSSLLRHFKLVFGKGIQEYYVEMKMELAKKMIGEKKHTVKMIAETLGYKHASPFIETFTKQFGYSPGSLRTEYVI